jgi:hypothetical protein
MSTVWVVHERPMSKIDISPAHAFGDIVYILDGMNPQITDGNKAAEIEEEIASVLENEYIRGDYFMPIGDPVAVTIAMGIILQLTNDGKESNGDIQLLKWDRKNKSYHVVPVRLQPYTAREFTEKVETNGD